jgi:(p)ppGpp synthase/HD superfamily hydrolase
MQCAVAMGIAVGAHAGQRRKYTGEPYVEHPVEVAEILMEILQPEDWRMVMMGYLHDTIEDTDVTAEYLRRMDVDETVVQGVEWLTDASATDGLGGNREARKARDRAKLAEAPADVQTVKCADLISNTRDIAEHDPRFARKYLPECLATLSVLTKANRQLRARAERQATRALKELEDV